MGKIKRIVSMLLAVVLISCVLGSPQDVNANSRLSIPRLGKWKVTYDGKLDPDIYHRVTGMKHTITWKPVRGATGYQVATSAKGSTVPSKIRWCALPRFTVMGTHADVGHSGYTHLRARVRAYKLIKGKATYGPWSKWVSTRITYRMPEYPIP